MSESSLKEVSFIQRFKNLLAFHKRSFVGSTVRGITKCGRSTSPTLPQIDIAPEANLISIVSEIKRT